MDSPSSQRSKMKTERDHMEVRTSSWQMCGPEAVGGWKQVPEEATVLKIRTRRLHFRSKQKSWWEGGFQEDPESELRMEDEQEPGDAEFRREFRNSLCSQDT